MPDTALSLLDELTRRAPHDAANFLSQVPPTETVDALLALNPMLAQQILTEMDDLRRCEIIAAAPIEKARQWMRNQEYPEDSVGWLMEPPVAVFRPQMTVRETIEALRVLTKKSFITYGYVTDTENRLLGVLVMRDLMLGDPEKPLSEIMWTRLFTLQPEMSLPEAMKAAVNRHYPVYPVCDAQGRLLGLVRGQTLFEARAIEISAQPGTMMGVEKEERLATPMLRSLRLRHLWLQVNLFTGFAAGAVVGAFQDTINQALILAVFLPVMAGQSGNTGCQALAVALRSLTLGEIAPGQERRLVLKEGILGLLNGALVGITAAAGMVAYAFMQGNEKAWILGGIVFAAMVGSCIVSGLCGAMIPLGLRKLGTDPATASSIFLTTATDIVSMSFFLALATWLLI